jgi:hypothetical protein
MNTKILFRIMVLPLLRVCNPEALNEIDPLNS